MVAREDRVFLARVARLNQALAASALPLLNQVLDAADGRRLGKELIEIGEEFVRRSHSHCGTDLVVDAADVEVAWSDGPHGLHS